MIINIMSPAERAREAAEAVRENNLLRAVICASMGLTALGPNVRTAYYNLFVMPGYFSSIPLLLGKLMLQAREPGLGRLKTWICAEDKEKLE